MLDLPHTGSRPGASLGSDRGVGSRPHLSIVIPVKDEEDSVERLFAEILAATLALGETFEVVFVNDGSTDGTEAILERIAKAHAEVHLINLRRCFGQTAAMDAGFRAARGDVIVAMDADLQNDPQDIGRLLAKMDEGFDLVSGWRRHRQDRMLSRRVPSIVANWMIGTFLSVRLHDYGCSLKAYRREILREVALYGEMHRFIPAFAAQVGARIAEIEVGHRARQYGKTKYGIIRTFSVLMDMITVKFLMKFSTKPMHLFGAPGAVATLFGVAILLYLTVVKFARQTDIGDRPLLLLGVLSVILGFQSLSIGLLGEMNARTHFEATKKLPYIIKSEVLNRELRRP